MGVQFETLENFYTPHVGLLWDSLDRNRYPTFEEVAPIFTPEKLEKDAFILFDNKPMMPRIWFINEHKDTILQFQRDRFLCNWRKYTTDSILEKDYPRYEGVKKEFYDSIENLEKCLSDLKISTINPQRLELTYINVVPMDAIGGLSHIGSILKDATWHAEHQVLKTPHKMSANWQFPVKEINSLLDLRIASVPLPLTGQDALRIELTVYGQAPYKSIKECESWFDAARRTIVTGFVDITTLDAHNMWGLSYE